MMTRDRYAMLQNLILYRKQHPVKTKHISRGTFDCRGSGFENNPRGETALNLK